MPELAIDITSDYDASGATAAKRDLGELSRQGNAVTRTFGGLQNTMSRGFKVAAVGVGAGVAAVGAAFGAAVADGIKFNSSIENVNAQLLAFTKDGDVAAKILADIRKESALTPFGFEEMARATASLLPAAKQSGAELMDLVKTAEILAASNPAEGLEGAAFAIREALSGDFVSIIERFNLPRQRLNELKEQGVPAMEAIGIAMAEMGLDADLVTNLAETMTGRWSTFQDTMDTLKSSLTQPIFDFLKESLTGLQGVLDANLPRLQEFASMIGERIAGALRQFVTVAQAVANNGFGVLFTVFEDGSSYLSSFLEKFGLSETAARNLASGILTLAGDIRTLLSPVVDTVAKFVEWKDVLGALGIVAASIVVPALWGIVAAIAPQAALFAGLVTAVAGLRTAWEADFLGIRTAAESTFTQLGDLWNGIMTAFETGDTSGLERALGGLSLTLQGWMRTAKDDIYWGIRGWWTQFTGTEFGAELVTSFNTTMAGLERDIEAFFDWADIGIKLPRLDPNDIWGSTGISLKELIVPVQIGDLVKGRLDVKALTVSTDLGGDLGFIDLRQKALEVTAYLDSVIAERQPGDFLGLDQLNQTIANIVKRAEGLFPREGSFDLGLPDLELAIRSLVTNVGGLMPERASGDFLGLGQLQQGIVNFQSNLSALIDGDTTLSFDDLNQALLNVAKKLDGIATSEFDTLFATINARIQEFAGISIPEGEDPLGFATLRAALERIVADFGGLLPAREGGDILGLTQLHDAMNELAARVRGILPADVAATLNQDPFKLQVLRLAMEDLATAVAGILPARAEGDILGIGQLKTALTEAAAAIQDFGWKDWIEKVEWPATIHGFEWLDFVTAIDLTTMVVQLPWDDYVSELEWPDIDWLGWNEWIDKLEWPTIDWSGWDEWIPELRWPSITWPGWTSFIPRFPGWPDIRSMVASYIQGRVEPQYNSPGTTSSGTIGGRSALIPVTPAAAQPVPSSRFAPAGGVVINVNSPVNSDVDRRRLAIEVAEEINRRRG